MVNEFLDFLNGNWSDSDRKVDFTFSINEMLIELNSLLDKPLSKQVLYNHLRGLGLTPITYGRYHIADLYVVYAWITRDGGLRINVKEEFMIKRGNSIHSEARLKPNEALATWNNVKNVKTTQTTATAF